MGSLSMFIQMVVYAYSVLEVLHMNDRLITVSIKKRKSNNRIKKAQKWSPTCTHRVGTMQDTPKGNKLRNTKTKLKSQTKTCLNKGTTSKILPKSNPSKKKDPTEKSVWCNSVLHDSNHLQSINHGMEALSCLINRAVRGGFLSSCRLRGRSGSGIQVSHLLFADDTLVFCEDSQDQMAILSWLLLWFEAISGLSINLNKSEILSVGRVENAEVLASELGCKVGSLPSTYLGLPLGAPHKSVAMWDGVEERMRKRLALWKRQFISKGGRITLIRSTLVSMPIYLMSLLRMPRVVRLRFEKIQRISFGMGVRWRRGPIL